MTGLPIWAAAGIGAAVTTVLNNTDIGNAWYLDVLEKTADAMALAIILPFSKIGKLIDVPLNGVESLVMNYFLQVYEAGVNLIIEFIEEIKKSFFRTSVAILDLLFSHNSFASSATLFAVFFISVFTLYKPLDILSKPLSSPFGCNSDANNYESL